MAVVVVVVELIALAKGIYRCTEVWEWEFFIIFYFLNF